MSAGSLRNIAELNNRQISIRPLTGNDSDAYRALRQRILALGEGKYFSSSYTRENQFVTELQWRRWCTESREHCIIGTFLGEHLIGIMAISMYGQPKDQIAEWDSTWLDPKYRTLGIAKLAYDKVWKWTQDNGYTKAIVDIKAGNERSLHIRKQQGAVYSHTKHNEMWADGSVADTHYFALNLFQPAHTADKLDVNAARQIQKTLSALEAVIEESLNLVVMHDEKRADTANNRYVA